MICGDPSDRGWVGDITDVRTNEGWAYLSVLVDGYARAVVGGSLDNSLHRNGALRALRHALGVTPTTTDSVHSTLNTITQNKTWRPAPLSLS